MCCGQVDKQEWWWGEVLLYTKFSLVRNFSAPDVLCRASKWNFSLRKLVDFFVFEHRLKHLGAQLTKVYNKSNNLLLSAWITAESSR